jgi:hypothetical protein
MGKSNSPLNHIWLSLRETNKKYRQNGGQKNFCQFLECLFELARTYFTTKSD